MLKDGAPTGAPRVAKVKISMDRLVSRAMASVPALPEPDATLASRRAPPSLWPSPSTWELGSTVGRGAPPAPVNKRFLAATIASTETHNRMNREEQMWREHALERRIVEQARGSSRHTRVAEAAAPSPAAIGGERAFSAAQKQRACQDTEAGARVPTAIADERAFWAAQKLRAAQGDTANCPATYSAPLAAAPAPAPLICDDVPRGRGPGSGRAEGAAAASHADYSDSSGDGDASERRRHRRHRRSSHRDGHERRHRQRRHRHRSTSRSRSPAGRSPEPRRPASRGSRSHSAAGSERRQRRRRARSGSSSDNDDPLAPDGSTRRSRRRRGEILAAPSPSRSPHTGPGDRREAGDGPGGVR